MQQTNEATFINILMQDAIASIERHAEEDRQLTRRDLVRTLFAVSEGLVWVFREHLTDSAAKMDKLELKERAALSEESYVVTEQGKISAQPRYISMKAAMRLCVRIAQRLDTKLEIGFDDLEWQNFVKFVDLRNRLAHPKTLDDLDISTDDASLCLSAFFWLLEIVIKSLASANHALIAYRDDMREIIELLKAGDPKAIIEYEIAARLIQDDEA